MIGCDWSSDVCSSDLHQSTQDLVIMHQKTEEGKAQLKKWSSTYQFTQKDGVTYKDSQTVVSGGNNLKRGVIHFYHETPSAGHPGISNTYELMKRDFWWPNMKQDAEQYVKGCAACQANKINTHPLKPTIFPITPVIGLPFQTIAMDFITKLPKSGNTTPSSQSRIMTVAKQLSLSLAKRPLWQKG